MFSLSPDPIRDALQARADHLSRLVGWANITVAVGVALEGVEIIHGIVAWGKKKRRRKRERIELKEIAEVFPADELRQSTELHADEPRWVKRLLRVGLIIVVIGVIAEWRCGAKLEDAHNAVHQHDLEKITAADEKASDAATSAKTARDLGTDLLEKYNTAERELTELKAARLPRRLSSTQKAAFRKRIASFAIQAFTVGCINGGSEALDFEQDFVDAVLKPKPILPAASFWYNTSCTQSMGGNLVPPLSIVVGDERKRDRDILVQALVDVGIKRKDITIKADPSSLRLSLFVGPKSP
jgi:hypothetical protein